MQLPPLCQGYYFRQVINDDSDQAVTCTEKMRSIEYSIRGFRQQIRREYITTNY